MAGRMGLLGSVGPPCLHLSAWCLQVGTGGGGWSLLSRPRWIRAPRAGSEQAEIAARGTQPVLCLSPGQEDSWRLTWECGDCSK